MISANMLEPEDSETLKSSDMFKGNTLLWTFSGKKYAVTLLEIYGEYLHASHVHIPHTQSERF